MDIPKQSADEKKSKPSFWNRLLRLPRKSNIKEKHEDSFRRQSMLYSSLNNPKYETPGSSTSEDSENFTTLESSALHDIHRDAGILFLNKSCVENCFTSKEDNKHVQFAPTPMNKYYKVDVKSAPSMKQQDDNKENLQQRKSVKPSRPILRTDKSRKSSSSAEDTESNPESKLLNVTYIDGPKLKTPTIPRTSTKIALVDRKNGSVPQLNVSSIVKYNSLPRNPKVLEEIGQLNEKEHFAVRSSAVKSTEYLCNQPNRNICQQTNVEQRYRRSMRALNTHRQSCYGVSEPSRLFEGTKILKAQNQELDQNTRRRLSLGPPLHYNYNETGHQTENINSNIHLRLDMQKNSVCNVPLSLRSRSYARSLDQPVRPHAIKQNFTAEISTNKLNKQIYHASTGDIPNKAINEVGLPIPVNMKRKIITSKKRSKSPQYIALSETFTTNKNSVNNNKNKMLLNDSQKITLMDTNKFSESNNLKKQIASSWRSASAQINKKQNIGNSKQSQEPSSTISETRKQAILSTMYSQKRKFVNKICKYNSKQSDEGFSSMADDECSFNCSCPSCVIKLSRSYKRNGFKQLFPHNKEKFFFTIEPDIQESNELERLPENQTFEGPMALAQPHLSSKNENDLAQNKTWYDCNDTLCQTPGKCNSSTKDNGKEFTSTPAEKMVDNIYENITQIINSATKKNLTPQDVKMLLSTPMSNSQRLQKASQRKLFSDEQEISKLDQSLKRILSPAKTPDALNDSLVLLQEIFQKLSQECKELLQPNLSSNSSNQTCSTLLSHDSPGGKYVNDLVKNLKNSDLSEADFANIIGGIAQNIFTETKARKKQVRTLVHSTSLPDLQQNTTLLNNVIRITKSLRNLCDLQIAEKSTTGDEKLPQNTNTAGTDSVLSGDSVFGNRELPDGWSRTPTTEDSNFSNDASSSTKLSSSETDKDSSKLSQGESQLLENVIRLGMGLSPVDKVKKTPMFSASPMKVTKYKSRDVLSGKEKLKLKIYYNSGLVTVYVMKAAKLDWASGRELNAYVKITMTPDESKRVHWRTNVQKAQKSPVFNQKFSFELLAEDVTNRLVFSVWHRDYSNQRSELIGCMSFSVRHVMDNTHNVDGWYRLLREKFGTQKHFAAHTRRNSCSFKQ